MNSVITILVRVEEDLPWEQYNKAHLLRQDVVLVCLISKKGLRSSKGTLVNIV